MSWSYIEQQGKLYGRSSRDGKKHHPKDLKRFTQYKRDMIRKPTRAEQRFKRILCEYFGLPLNASRKQCKKHFVTQKIFMFNNHRFLRTEDVKGYIVDFYLPEYSLVIEIDGDSHDNPYSKSYDDTRTAVIKDKNIKCLRILNEQTNNKDLCLVLIKEAIDTPLQYRAVEKTPSSFFANITRDEELALQEQAIKDGKLQRYRYRN